MSFIGLLYIPYCFCQILDTPTLRYKRFVDQSHRLKNNMEYSNSMKVSSALILREGDFVCFFMLGDDYGGENIGEGSSEETEFYKSQQQIGEECWHNIFYEK